jgi:hypothetical protein
MSRFTLQALENIHSSHGKHATASVDVLLSGAEPLRGRAIGTLQSDPPTVTSMNVALTQGISHRTIRGKNACGSAGLMCKIGVGMGRGGATRR